MGSVHLIGVTSPKVKSANSPEQLIAYAARVSNPTNQTNTDTATKLLKYLVKHKHWSPFEMVHVLMEINTTRDIARQILRHRSFSFQEFSQRYADPAELGSELREARLQDLKNRQNSIEIQDSLLQEHWNEYQTAVLNTSIDAYNWAIDAGIAKEQARSILPEGLIKSRMYMSGSVRSWIHYIQVRASPDTQKEHRVIAEECKIILLKEFPSLKGLFDENI